MASINRRHDDNKSSSSSGSWNNVLCVLLLLVSNAVTFWTHRLSWPLDSTITPSSSSVAVPQSNAALLWSSAEQQGAPECCHLAYEHSFGLFDDIADHEWREFYQKPSLNPVRYYNPTSPNSNAFQNPTLWVFENYDPWFHCPRQHRLGGLGDGPKYMCDPDRLNRLFETRVRKTAAERRQLPPQPFLAAAHSNKNNHLEKPCLVYSFVDGNRDNYRWEESLAELVPNKCEIHIFDSSRKAPHENPLWPHNNDRNSIHFHPWALTSSQTTSSVETAITVRVSFGEIRKRLDHEGRTIDFFKMDCGGCEWYATRRAGCCR